MLCVTLEKAYKNWRTLLLNLVELLLSTTFAETKIVCWNKMADSNADENSNLNELSAKLCSSRARKPSHITRRINIVSSLMSDSEDLEEVKGNMDKFYAMLDDFKSMHESYEQTLSEQDKK